MNSVSAEEASTAAVTGKTASALVLGLTGDAWDRILVCALIVMVMAMVVVGLAASNSVLSRRREAEAAAQKVDRLAGTVAARIAAARADGVAVGKAAADAAAQAERERLTAENSERQKIIERDVTARLPAKKEPKSAGPQPDGPGSAGLSSEKMTALTATLKSGPGNVSIDYDGVDTKTQPISMQLQRAFENAGWNVSSGIMLGIANPPKTGILIRVNQAGATAQQELTTRAFKAAGIPFDLRPDRQPKPYTNGQAHVPFGMGANDVEVFVTAPHR